MLNYNFLNDVFCFYVCLILFGCLFFDFLYFRIPNFFVCSLLVGFGFQVLLTAQYGLLSNAWLLLAIIVAGYGLFYINAIGAGDVKLLAALSLWVGWPDILQVILWMSIYGGLLAAIILIFPKVINTVRRHAYKVKHLSKISLWLIPDLIEVEQEAISEKSHKCVPYGVAISIASIEFLIKKWLSDVI